CADMSDTTRFRLMVIQYPSDSDSDTLNQDVLCLVTLGKSPTFKITLTVCHRVSTWNMKK
ncbi:MAG: hypothetical protein ACJARS_000335, partial [bacterium]